MRLIVETTDPALHPGFSGPDTDLLTFLTFGASERYGALHPLSGVANLLRRKHGVDVEPLLHFGDAVPEDDEDQRNLEALWQEPEPLAEAAAAAADRITTVPRLMELAADFPALPDRLADLERIARWAAERGARVRITYALE